MNNLSAAESTWFWIIYAIGYVVNYYYCRYLMRRDIEIACETYNWSNVIALCTLSTLSWIMIIIVTIVLIYTKLPPLPKNHLNGYNNQILKLCTN